jgi:hypothetical protein
MATWLSREDKIFAQLFNLKMSHRITDFEIKSKMPGKRWTIETLHHGTLAYTTHEVEIFLRAIEVTQP